MSDDRWARPRRHCGDFVASQLRDSMFSSFEGAAKEYLGGGRRARTAAGSIGVSLSLPAEAGAVL